jgi:Protein of unknown function (DUF1566)
MKTVLMSCLSLAASLLATGAAGQTRYAVSAGEQEVTDARTGLTWRRCAEGMTVTGGNCGGVAGTFTHEAALRHAASEAGSTGLAWRLPNVKELSSITDRTRAFPAIDPTAFPGTPSNWFWSSSPYVNDPSNAWYVNFNYGSPYFFGGRGLGSHVRLVRGGQ